MLLSASISPPTPSTTPPNRGQAAPDQWMGAEAMAYESATYRFASTFTSFQNSLGRRDGRLGGGSFGGAGSCGGSFEGGGVGSGVGTSCCSDCETTAISADGPGVTSGAGVSASASTGAASKL